MLLCDAGPQGVIRLPGHPRRSLPPEAQQPGCWVRNSFLGGSSFTKRLCPRPAPRSPLPPQRAPEPEEQRIVRLRAARDVQSWGRLAESPRVRPGPARAWSPHSRSRAPGRGHWDEGGGRGREGTRRSPGKRQRRGHSLSSGSLRPERGRATPKVLCPKGRSQTWPGHPPSRVCSFRGSSLSSGKGMGTDTLAAFTNCMCFLGNVKG